MNRVESWIESGITKRPIDWNWRLDGYYIEDIIPEAFETYALIYHPYKLPHGQIITNEKSEQNEKRKFLENLNKKIEQEFKIPFSKLPNKEYNIEQTIRNKINPSLFSDEQLNNKIEEFEKYMLGLAFQPLQDALDNIEAPVETIARRETPWSEVFQFYELEYNKNSSWYDTFELQAKNKIFNAEMPDQDKIPESVLQELQIFFTSNDIDTVDINSLSNVIAPKSLINKDSENYNCLDLINSESIHLISSINRDWIFINPYDYCRTIIGGTLEFIKSLRENSSLEISENVNSKHRINKMYTDNTR